MAQHQQQLDQKDILDMQDLSFLAKCYSGVALLFTET